jgi:uncharacterized protein (TIGR00255 family)
MVLRSMTGYARVSKVVSGKRAVLEITSINKRVLEMHVYLPRTYLYYDLLLREWMRKSLTRGQVTVRLYFESEKNATGESSLATLKGLKKQWDETATKLGYDSNQAVTLDFLMQQVPLAVKEELEEKDLKELADKALNALFKMKEKEGATLEKDIRSRLANIAKRLKHVEKQVPKIVERQKERLSEKIKGFATGDFEEKMAREVVLFADRVDVTEEIVRLHSHLQQFEKFLMTTEKSIGRTLEFLVQEIHRELNTMAAKVSDSNCIHNVVEMKSLVDQIREQVQNIE